VFRNATRGLAAVAIFAAFLAFTPAAMTAPAICDTRVNDTTAELLQCVTLEDVRAHQQAFQNIANANGGTRAANTPGYDASVDYVVDRMEAAGYDVTLDTFPYPFAEPSILQQTAPIVATYETLSATGTGFGTVTDRAVTDVDINLVPPRANTSGCQGAFTEESVGAPHVPDPGGPDDFAGFASGNIALVQRGGCSFGLKAVNAQAAGAAAVVIFNQGNTAAPDRNGLFGATLAPSTVGIPVVTAAFANGEALAQVGSRATIFVDEPETVEEVNVIAESPGGDPTNVVMAGAHLDSVPAGPGINDNGSGSAALLEVAEQMAKVNPANKLRFAWWGAEEDGLIGSSEYVSGLSDADHARISLYLNFDMVGSPNHVFFVYDGDNSDAVGAGPGPTGSAQIEKTFERYYSSVSLPFKGTDFDGRSDYGPFIATGVPSGGLFTGAEGTKTADEAARWGGTAGVAYDPCYHQACDTFANNNDAALGTNSDAMAFTILQYASSTVDVQFAQVSQGLQAIIAANPGPLADKVEDALAKFQSASAELAKTRPDRQAAIGNIEGANGDLEAAVKEGLDAAQGAALMDELTSVARQFAAGAINMAIANNRSPSRIAEAQRSLADGDALRTAGRFKDAVNKYKDALSKVS
jgi:Zn-dependent M28 family amino/carboxypeptidase